MSLRNGTIHGQDCAALALGLVLAALGCHHESTKPAASAVPAPKVASPTPIRVSLDSNFMAARRAFEDKRCSQCHSIFEKETKAGPRLDASKVRGSFLDIFAVIWNHAPAMEVHMRRAALQPPQFSTTELNQIVSFLYLVPYLDPPGNPGKGNVLLSQKQCLTCHSLHGRGNLSGVSLDQLAQSKQSQISLLQRMWNHGPVMNFQMGKSGIAKPRFQGSDFADLISAISAPAKGVNTPVLSVGDAKNGGTVFEKKGCLRCHSVLGKGGKDGPDLGTSLSPSSLTALSTQLWNHSVGMQAKFKEKSIDWPTISETEMNDLIVFLYAISYEDKGGDPKKGEALFASKKCAECHFKNNVSKKQLMRTLSSVDSIRFATLLWNHIPSMEGTMASQGIPWPELKGNDMRDILAYLQHQ